MRRLFDMVCPAHKMAAGRGFHLVEDIDLLRLAAQKATASEGRQEALALELGSGCRGGAGGGACGTTANAVLWGRREGIRMITVDPDEEALLRTAEAVRGPGMEHRWAAIHPEARHNLLMAGDVDLLVIDGQRTGHWYLAELLKEWLPLLRPGGFFWIHDFGDTKALGLRYSMAVGPQRAVQQLVRSHDLEEIEQRGASWLGRRTV